VSFQFEETSMIAGFIVGVIFFAFVYAAWHIFELRKKRLTTPRLFIFNPIADKNLSAGRIEKIERDSTDPLLKDVQRKIWAIHTDTLIIIPAYGDLNAMLIGDDGSIIKFLIADVISSQYSDTLKGAVDKWWSEMFPGESPGFIDLENNSDKLYAFVRPVYGRKMSLTEELWSEVESRAEVLSNE